MKLLHVADLHVGKRVNEFSMLEEQEHILGQILQMMQSEKADGILIAGDVYDKSQPSSAAVELLDDFLTRLTALGKPVFMISGNHDSPERLGFGSRILEKNGLYIAGVFDGTVQKVSLDDVYGKVNIYLLPFLKPAMARPYFEKPFETYDETVRSILEATQVSLEERNVLVAHQFVLDEMREPERSDSESVSVGGLDHVDVSAFQNFDYVALGHIHRPQKIGRSTVRYAGSPLKYSFSEAHHTKSVTVVELGEKGKVTVNQLALTPLRDLREIKGPIKELLQAGLEDKEAADDYMHITLTDEEEIYDALGQLRQVYPNLMVLDFMNTRSSEMLLGQGASLGDIAKKSPMDLFGEFYEMQNGKELTSEQNEILGQVFERAGGE